MFIWCNFVKFISYVNDESNTRSRRLMNTCKGHVVYKTCCRTNSKMFNLDTPRESALWRQTDDSWLISLFFCPRNRSVWPPDFASASRTTTRRSARASHTMSAAAAAEAAVAAAAEDLRCRVTTIRWSGSRSNSNRSRVNRCSRTAATAVAAAARSRSRATTCRRTRSPPATRSDPPQVRFSLRVTTQSPPV